MDVASNSGCVISIFDDHLQFNNTVIKGYLYHELLLILQSGKIPTELIDVLPTNLKVTDHRYQQTYNICLAPSLKANFDLMESTASSNFDMLMRESEQLKSVKIDLSDFNFNKRAHDHFIEHKYNAVIKKQRIEEIEDIIEDNAQVDDDFNLELMYKPADVSFLSKLNQVRHVLKERQSIPIETIEENKVKSIVGFVIVQSLKFKHKWQNRYLTVNLLSSQSEDYFQAVLYFGSQPDTILDGFQTRIAIGPRNAISISFDQLINSYKAVYDVVFDSKLNIASPPQSRQAVATPDLDEIQSDTVTQQQQYTNHQQLPPKQRLFTPQPQQMQNGQSPLLNQQPHQSPNVMYSPNYRQMQYRQQQTPPQFQSNTQASPLVNGQMYRPINNQQMPFNYQMYQQMPPQQQQLMQQAVQQQQQQQQQQSMMMRMPHPQMMYRMQQQQMQRPMAYRPGIQGMNMPNNMQPRAQFRGQFVQRPVAQQPAQQPQ